MNVTVTTHFVADFSVAGQLLVCVKSAELVPVILMLLIVIADLPLLPRVSACVTGVPTIDAGKVQHGFKNNKFAPLRELTNPKTSSWFCVPT